MADGAAAGGAGAAAPAAAAEPAAAFKLPALSLSADAWGPTGVPPQFEKVPFASFNRSDRVNRVADFGGFTRGPQRELAAAPLVESPLPAAAQRCHDGVARARAVAGQA